MQVRRFESYILTFLLIGNVASISLVDPLVYWSMDKYKDNKLLPDFGNEEIYSCDLSILGQSNNYVQTGIKGNALHLNKRKIDLIENIWRSDCIRNPVKCEDGLTLSLWLNVKEFTSRRNQVIVRSTSSYRSRPGIYIGGDDKDENSLLFFVRTAEGKQYQADIPRYLVMDRWTHVAMTWTNATGIKVSINGTQLGPDEYTATPTVKDARRSYPMKVDFIAGDILGPNFSLDEFWIFYDDLSSEEIFSLYENALPAESTTTMSTTTTTTEQTPPPRIYTKEMVTTPLTKVGNTTIAMVSTTSYKNIIVPSVIMKTYNTTKQDVVMVKTTKEPIRTTSTSIKAVPQYTNTTTLISKSTMPQEVTIKTTTISNKSTTTRRWFNTYTGWFYHQTWFYVIVAGSFLLLFAVSIYLAVVHCVIPACEKEVKIRQSLTNRDDQVTEALV